MEEHKGEKDIMKDEIVVEKDEIVAAKDEHIESVAESQLPVYKPKDKIVCEICGAGYIKNYMSKHSKIC